MRLVDKAVLEVIQRNERERLTETQIADHVEISTRTVRRAIKRLRRGQLIKAVGDNRNRTYEVVLHVDQT